MKQKEFAELMKFKPSFWSMVLSGKRNLGFEKARTVAHVLSTSTDLWVDPKADPKERVEAWEKFNRRKK